MWVMTSGTPGEGQGEGAFLFPEHPSPPPSPGVPGEGGWSLRVLPHPHEIYVHRRRDVRSRARAFTRRAADGEVEDGVHRLGADEGPVGHGRKIGRASCR